MTQAERVFNTPRTAASDLFEELLLPDPESMADLVIERLRNSGFVILPTEQKLSATLERAETAEARCVGLEAMLVDAQKEIETLKRAP